MRGKNVSSRDKPGSRDTSCSSGRYRLRNSAIRYSRRAGRAVAVIIVRFVADGAVVVVVVVAAFLFVHLVTDQATGEWPTAPTIAAPPPVRP